MAVKSLAIKYRPQTFDDVVEQSSIKVILHQQLVNNETKNAYLFCGGAGTGKTTCARIFANEINHHQGNPIEMDAASNSSVDDVREIIQQAKTKSLDSEYKVFIIDECFPAGTLIKTKDGYKPIQDIRTNDYVLGMSGYKPVTHLFQNRVLTSRLCCVIIGDRKIITTAEHLFFTNIGWVRACDLQKGDIVYDNQSVQELWKRVHEDSGQGHDVLFSELRQSLYVGQNTTGNERVSVSCLSEEDNSAEEFTAEDLLKEVRYETGVEVIFSVDEYRMWDGVSETIIRKNVKEQPYGEFADYREDATDKTEEWDFASLAHESGRQREVHYSTDSLVASLRRWLGFGVPNKHEESKLARTTNTLVLQSRPWFTDNENCSRGRWSRPSMEKLFIKGCEENGLSGNARVESVEIYKRGNNEQLFRGSFTDKELSGKYVTLYDLEVDEDHSYFVNGILVHNCHSISNTGWQAFLKLIEEPPAKSIFIFCTTDPQKIPRTILSRVQRYDFQRISFDGVVNRLKYILNKEQVPSCNKYGDDCSNCNSYIDGKCKAVEESLGYIAKIADGGMRDAITLLDKCLAYSPNLTIENVIKAIGTVDYDTMFFLTDSIITNEVSDVLTTIEGVHKSGKDLKQFIKTYTNFVLDLNKFGCLRNFDSVEIPVTYRDKLERYNDHAYEDFKSLLATLVKLNANIKWETSPKAMIEATLVLRCMEVEK